MADEMQTSGKMVAAEKAVLGITPCATASGSAAAVEGPGLRVLLVDDHAAVRDSLARALCQTAGPDWQVFQAAGGAQALAWLEEQTADVAAVDMSMPGMNGFELIGELRRRHPTLPSLMLSMHEEEPYALRAVEAGARGYLMKDQAALHMVAALRRLHAGGLHLSAGVTEKLLISLSRGIERARRSRLTPREFEALERLSLGEPSDRIAASLDVDPGDVDLCRQRVIERLGMPCLAGLIRDGRAHGLADPRPLTGRAKGAPPPAATWGRATPGT